MSDLSNDSIHPADFQTPAWVPDQPEAFNSSLWTKNDSKVMLSQSQNANAKAEIGTRASAAFKTSEWRSSHAEATATDCALSKQLCAVP